MRGEVARLSNQRTAALAQVGNPGPGGSIAKLAMAELNKDVYDLCVTLQGANGQIGFDYTFRRPDMLEATGAVDGPGHAFLRVRANSIEGGTSEIMRNILGEQVLGLPGEPRVDKDVAVEPSPTVVRHQPHSTWAWMRPSASIQPFFSA